MDRWVGGWVGVDVGCKCMCGGWGCRCMGGGGCMCIFWCLSMSNYIMFRVLCLISHRGVMVW